MVRPHMSAAGDRPRPAGQSDIMTVAVGPFFRGLLFVILAFVPTVLVYLNYGAPRGGTLSAILVILMYVAVEEVCRGLCSLGARSRALASGLFAAVGIVALEALPRVQHFEAFTAKFDGTMLVAGWGLSALCHVMAWALFFVRPRSVSGLVTALLVAATFHAGNNVSARLLDAEPVMVLVAAGINLVLFATVVIWLAKRWKARDHDVPLLDPVTGPA